LNNGAIQIGPGRLACPERRSQRRTAIVAIVIAAAWMLVVSAVAGMCRAASSGDEHMPVPVDQADSAAVGQERRDEPSYDGLPTSGPVENIDHVLIGSD
jgi:hypothetical protein